MADLKYMLQQAELVRDANKDGENTAYRVGALFCEIIDVLNECGDLDVEGLKDYLDTNLYITSSALETYALKADIPSLDDYYNKSDINTKISDVKDLINNYDLLIKDKLDKSIFDKLFRLVEKDGQQFIETDFTFVSKGDLVSFYAGEGVNISSFATTEMLKQYITSEALEARLKDLNVGVGGLDMEALESYLTENSYATQDWVKRQGFLTGITGFLPLSGGTLSDALTIQCGADTKLSFNNTDGEKYSAIKFLESGTEYSRMIGHEHKFEFSKYIEAPKFVAQTTDLCQNVNADMLDGYHASNFSLTSHYHNYIQSCWRQNDISGTSMPETGLRLIEVYDNGYPCTYGNVIEARSNGAGRLLLEWTASDSTGRIFYKSKRDTTAHGWSAWKQVAYITDNVAQATEMYNATYGGGWYMSDSTWIRARNDKSIWTAGEYRTELYFNRVTYSGTSWNNGYGAYNIAIANNASQTPLMVACRSGYAPSVTGTNRLFAMEFLNTGTLLRFCFGGSNKYDFNSDGTLVAAGDLVSHSDRRLKSDIKDLVFRGALQPRTYIKDGKRCIGFVAQEVEPLYPETVLKGELWSVNYGALVAVLAGQNNTQQKQLNSHDERISAIERKLNMA